MNIINPIGDELYRTLIRQGFNWVQAGYIVAQAAHETGNFSSPLFKNANNCFGMKYAGQFWASGKYNDYAKYNSLKDCVKDFASYYIRRAYKDIYPDLRSYVKALKEAAYFEANEEAYFNGCLHFYKLYF